MRVGSYNTGKALGSIQDPTPFLCPLQKNKETLPCNCL